MSISTSDLCDRYADAIDIGQLSVLRGNWQWFGTSRYLKGQAVTLEARGCNLELRQLLKQSGNGQVLVIDSGDHMGALLGDNLATLALSNGWSGVLINGNVRDTKALAIIDLPVIATGTWPIRSQNLAGGKPGATLMLGGSCISQGDWIYADEDGVLLSKRELNVD
ncbi:MULTISPECIES: hypothetical protein [Pseudomonas]|uniref:RraA family protein n=1 Tax=Pseudomonas TaxID=286 RepID=UPI000D40BA75|nr:MULTISPECIES: hypothetical protein [Pseudomonas]PTC01789.1 hypothetical protein C9975_00140 [Thalassospira xiamenensis]ELF6204306.1 putative 4-hydroxy-4-methyl-2-oxoglutarate aldolase [Pseudomonas putida]MBF8806941.1 hypothetical protein [Pseudomonas asiatica]MCE0881718.1 hypothetical protein [Pseudomonas putida]MCE0966981.1 hypothetical protein [Pseudomonas sp. NMI4491_12]